jgi:hypothetical protein
MSIPTSIALPRAERLRTVHLAVRFDASDLYLALLKFLLENLLVRKCCSIADRDSPLLERFSDGWLVDARGERQTPKPVHVDLPW